MSKEFPTKDRPRFLLQSFLLIMIFFLATILRIYKIDIPLADHHSWRQADTAAVARNFVKKGFDFFHPRIDNMAPLHAPDLPNPKRYFMVEPPIYQTIVAGFYFVFGMAEKWARAVSIIFSLGTILFLYLLLWRLVNPWVGLLASFFMAVLPYSVFYSRVILPEPLMLFASLGMFYFFLLFLEEEGSWGKFFLAALFAALTFTLKSFPLFLVLPLAYLVWQKYGPSFWRVKKLYLFGFLSILPLLFWRFWISQYPEGIPPFDWLFNQGEIRFKGAFFHWIFAERIGKLILGYWGLVLFGIGLILKPGKKEGWFFHWYLAAFWLYVLVFAAGNVTHDYYQIPFIPLAAIFLAKGSYFLLNLPTQNFNRFFGALLLVVCSLFMLAFSWFEVRGFYFPQGGVDLAGQAVDKLTPPKTLVLTGDSNDATLLYNTHRYGWTGGYASYFPNTPETIERVKKMGASVYVTTKFEENSEFGQYLLKNFSVIKRTNQYIIFSLY